MNRRHLIALATAPLLQVAPTRGVRLREVRASLDIDNGTQVHVIVAGFLNERAAERHRRSWIGQPAEHLGEFYPQSMEVVEIDPTLSAMPASVTFHAVIEGEGAEHTEYVVGALRRETVSIIVRAKTGDERLVLEISHLIAGAPVPSEFSMLWSNESLRRFVPTTRNLGRPVDESNQWWP